MTSGTGSGGADTTSGPVAAQPSGPADPAPEPAAGPPTDPAADSDHPPTTRAVDELAELLRPALRVTRRRLPEVVAGIAVVLTVSAALALVGAALNDRSIGANPAVAQAEVLDVAFSRTLVRFTVANGEAVVPALGVFYPDGLQVGQSVAVEYDLTDPDLVRVAGRSAVDGALPLLFMVLGVWAVLGPLALWLRRRRTGAADDHAPDQVPTPAGTAPTGAAEPPDAPPATAHPARNGTATAPEAAGGTAGSDSTDHPAPNGTAVAPDTGPAGTDASADRATATDAAPTDAATDAPADARNGAAVLPRPTDPAADRPAGSVAG